jgi:hypothetical protein
MSKIKDSISFIHLLQKERSNLAHACFLLLNTANGKKQEKHLFCSMQEASHLYFYLTRKKLHFLVKDLMRDQWNLKKDQDFLFFFFFSFFLNIFVLYIYIYIYIYIYYYNKHVSTSYWVCHG